MALTTGDQVGAYQIVSILGYGGMGSVYKATHERLGKQVAIKIVHSDSEPSFFKRFVREAQIVAPLDHPNIVPIFDFFEVQGQFYLVMKLIEGVTLKEHLKINKLSFDQILAIATPLASALDYAHSKNILHRDIKPSNIMLDQTGTPYLADFGLAREMLKPESSFSAGVMIGTPHYMSPEQALGNAITHRADLYSFGVVLYEMFVGRVPFNDGTPYKIIQDHISAALPLPRSINPNIPTHVEMVLLRATAKRPEDRYESATALIEALQATITTSSTSISKTMVQNVFVHVPPSFTQAPVPTHNPQVAINRGAKITRAVALVLISFIAVVILFGIVRTRQANTIETVTPIPHLVVTELSLSDAESYLATHSTDPAAHLGVVRAHFALGEDERAGQALSQGLPIADDKAAYLLTAADLALKTSRTSAAIIIYIRTVDYALDKPEYPAVRAEVGETLYTLIDSRGTLTLTQLRNITVDTQTQSTALSGALLARALLVNNNHRLAEAALAHSLLQDSTLAEAHLILGELHASEGRIEDARVEWLLAHDSSEAPSWVRQRAQSFIDAAQ